MVHLAHEIIGEQGNGLITNACRRALVYDKPTMRSPDEFISAECQRQEECRGDGRDQH